MIDRKVVFLLCVLTAACLISCGTMHAEPLSSGRDCTAYPYASPFPPASPTYMHRYHGIDQSFLEMESGVGPVTPSEYAILDALLDESKQRLRPIPADLAPQDYDVFAVDALKTMDCILVRHGFVYPGVGLVQLLSDGLDLTKFSGIYLERLKSNLTIVLTRLHRKTELRPLLRRGLRHRFLSLPWHG